MRFRVLWRFGLPSLAAGLFIWWEFPSFAIWLVVVLGVVVGVSAAGSVALYRRWVPKLGRVTGFVALLVLWGVAGAAAFAGMPCGTPGVSCVVVGAGYGAAVGMAIPTTAAVVWLSMMPFVKLGRRLLATLRRSWRR